jgi:hypothetical protein
MQAANFCSKHGGEEAQSGQLICSLPDGSVETHPSTNLTAAGVGMKTIQKLMGHRNIGTTALYCEVSDAMMRNAVELV